MATKTTTSLSAQAKAVAKSAAAKKPASKPVKKKVAASKATPKSQDDNAQLDEMFDLAAETFRVMSAPMRLKIINCLCTEEKNVGQLLEEIDTTQPNMSQHLNTLFKAKILGRRREGVQIYYRIINERVVTLCRAVCTQIAIDSDIAHA